VLPELVWCGFGVLVMLMQPFVRAAIFYVSCDDRTLRDTQPSLRHACRPASAGCAVRFLSVSSAARGHGAFLVVLAAGHNLSGNGFPFAVFNLLSAAVATGGAWACLSFGSAAQGVSHRVFIAWEMEFILR